MGDAKAEKALVGPPVTMDEDASGADGATDTSGAGGCVGGCQVETASSIAKLSMRETASSSLESIRTAAGVGLTAACDRCGARCTPRASCRGRGAESKSDEGTEGE